MTSTRLSIAGRDITEQDRPGNWKLIASGSQEYIEASSPRRGQTKLHLGEIGRKGAAAKVAAHRTRDSKEIQSPGEVLHRHCELASQYGHQAD